MPHHSSLDSPRSTLASPQSPPSSPVNLSTLSLSSPPLSLSAHTPSGAGHKHVFSRYPERRASTSSLSPPSVARNDSCSLTSHLRTSSTCQLSKSSQNILSPNISHFRKDSLESHRDPVGSIQRPSAPFVSLGCLSNYSVNSHSNSYCASPNLPYRDLRSLSHEACASPSLPYRDLRSLSQEAHSVMYGASQSSTPCLSNHESGSLNRKLTPPSPLPMSPSHSLSTAASHCHSEGDIHSAPLLSRGQPNHIGG